MVVVKIGNCCIKSRPEDVSWVHSLSEFEIDLLVNLKLCILQRAKMIGHEGLAEKFDLKVLRAIAFVLMEYLKEKMKDSSVTLDAVKPAAFLDACNLLRCDHKGVVSVDDQSENTGVYPQILFKGPQKEVGSTLAVGSNLKRRKRKKSFSVQRKSRKLKTKIDLI